MRGKDIFIHTKKSKRLVAKNVFAKVVCENGVATILFAPVKSWKKYKKDNPEFSDCDFEECLRRDLIPNEVILVGGSYEITLSKK